MHFSGSSGQLASLPGVPFNFEIVFLISPTTCVSQYNSAIVTTYMTKHMELQTYTEIQSNLAKVSGYISVRARKGNEFKR